GQYSTYLRFFPESKNVRLHVVFMSPKLAGESHAGLHFIIDQQCFVLVGQVAQRLVELLAKVTIPALALNRFYDDTGNVIFIYFKIAFSLSNGTFFQRLCLLNMFFGSGISPGRGDDARPIELRKILNFIGIGIGERHRVAGASVKSLLKVEYFMPFLLPIPFLEILLDLPVESDLQGVFYRQC